MSDSPLRSGAAVPAPTVPAPTVTEPTVTEPTVTEPAGSDERAGLRTGLRVVLLGPKRGSNVGAACRAIKNMGAGRLVVVGGDYDRAEALRTAVHAGDVFESRIQPATFEEAVAPCRLVIGTTSRERPWNIPVDEIGDVFDHAHAHELAARDVALVFGPEDRGLSNEELARCHRLAFVPTADEYASLNLAQAVVVCLYEWRQGPRRRRPGDGAGAVVGGRAGVGDGVRNGAGDEAGGAATVAAACAQAEALADLRSVLEEIDFLHGDQADRVMATVTSMLTRGGLDEREVSILRGMVRQIRWAARRDPSAKDRSRSEE